MKPNWKELSLREKIGQTAMPSPTALARGFAECQSPEAYFKKYPFSGFYAFSKMKKADQSYFSSPEEMRTVFYETSKALKIPLLVAGDCEYGANRLFPQLHGVSSNMALGAARKGELAYRRSYFWAKEMRSAGVNWPFGPVVDLHTNFFGTDGIRRIAKDPETVAELVPYIIRGIHDAGCATSAKHFPGASNDYRDPHFCTNVDRVTREEWLEGAFSVWKAAVEAGAMSLMTAHSVMPAIEDSLAANGLPRPATASKKILELARKDLQFDGVLITDAVNMKGLAAAFPHEDVYVESFLAGHDIILFTDNDYFEVMEKAVRNGRIPEARIDEACRRVLELKEKIGLFEDFFAGEDLTQAEQEEFESVLYEIAKNALTVVSDRKGRIPFDPEKVHRVTIINVSPDADFLRDLNFMKEAFERRGISATVEEKIRSKAHLKEISDCSDLIIYACYLAQSRPAGMSFYSTPAEMNTLFHSLSYGAEKSVCASFGATSVYYNYFEAAETFINAYSDDKGTFLAFVDGILGDFPLVGKSPVPLFPEFKEN